MYLHGLPLQLHVLLQMKKNSQSYQIALSAIAVALASGALALGNYVDVLLGAAYVVAVFALMIPLARDYLWGASLGFIAILLLTFLFCGFSFLTLLPFAVFFGLHPIVNYLQKRFVKKKPLFWLCEPVKAVWFDLAMWLSFRFVFVPVLGLSEAAWYPFVEQYFFLVLFVGGTLFFAVYDALVFYAQRSMGAVLRRLRK